MTSVHLYVSRVLMIREKSVKKNNSVSGSSQRISFLVKEIRNIHKKFREKENFVLIWNFVWITLKITVMKWKMQGLGRVAPQLKGCEKCYCSFGQGNTSDQGKVSYASEYWRNKFNLSHCGTRQCHFVKRTKILGTAYEFGLSLISLALSECMSHLGLNTNTILFAQICWNPGFWPVVEIVWCDKICMKIMTFHVVKPKQGIGCSVFWSTIPQREMFLDWCS